MALEIIGREKALSWDEFKTQVEDDRNAVKDLQKEETGSIEHSDWIYRGHACSSWKLKTSLERFIEDELSENSDKYNPKKYYMYLSSITPAVSSLTNYKFSRFDPNKIEIRRLETLPEYELLCFARHLGFPSPLLDWTYSYYVAAFFAFRNAKRGSDVAVFAYKEWNGDARGGWVVEPIIDQHGPYVETHPRHYRQQSTYTVCRSEINEQVFFMNHETAVNDDSGNHKVKKFIISHTERDRALRDLWAMNINDYTLFGDDESLMNMLAIKEIKFSDIT